MPIAYYPTYRVTAADPSVGAYWQQWRRCRSGRAGRSGFCGSCWCSTCWPPALHSLAPAMAATPGRPGGVGPRPSAPIFLRPRRGVGGGLRPAGADLPPWKWTNFGPFDLPDEPAAALPGLLPRRLCGSARTASTAACSSTEGGLARRWAVWLAAALRRAGADGLHLADARRRRRRPSSSSSRPTSASSWPARRAASSSGGVSALRPAPVAGLRRPFRPAPMVCISCTMYLSSGCSMPCWTCPLFAIVKAAIVFGVTLLLSWGRPSRR